MKITAAVLREKKEFFSFEEIEIEEPRAHEVLVRIVATGVCRTDLKFRHRDSSDVPIVLGHEGAGVVERIGERVTKVQSGDKVVLSYHSCGGCSNCAKGHPYYCDSAIEINFHGTRSDGTSPLSKEGRMIRGAFFGQSSFATYAMASERNIVKVNEEVHLALLGPLGCSIQTGAGAVFNALKPRKGGSIAVFGCGPVGLSAVMAAVSLGCEKVISVDIQPNRLKLAQSLGATHTINTKEADAVDAIHQLTRGGADYALETSGLLPVFQQAVASLTPEGSCGFMTPPVGDGKSFDLASIFFGRRIFGIIQGESLPDQIIPQMIRMYLQGDFPFDRLIKFYPFKEINQAVEDSIQGITMKPVLVMDDEIMADLERAGNL